MDAIRCMFCGEMFGNFPDGETAILVAATHLLDACEFATDEAKVEALFTVTEFRAIAEGVI